MFYNASSSLVRAVVFILLQLAITSPSLAQDRAREFSRLTAISLGNVRLSELRQGSIVVQRSAVENDYLFFFATINLNGARFQLCQDPPPAPCEEVFSGRLTAGSMIGRFSLYGSSPKTTILIEPSKLKMTIGRVTSSFAPVFGGNLDLAGHKLWIENVDSTVYLEGGQTRGKLSFKTQDLTLTRGQLQLPGMTTRPVVNLRSRGEVGLGIDLSTGQLLINDAIFEVGPVEVELGAPETLRLETFSIQVSKLSFRQLFFAWAEGRFSVGLRDLSLTASRFASTGSTRIEGTVVGPITIASADSVAEQIATPLLLQNLIVTNLKAAAGVSALSGTGDFSFTGNQAALLLEEWSNGKARGTFNLRGASAKIRPGGGIVALELASVDANFSGSPIALEVALEVQLTSAMVDMDAPVSIKQWFDKCNDPYMMHLNAGSGPAAGSGVMRDGNVDISFRPGSMTARISAGYHRCDYREHIHIDEQRLYFKYWCPTWSEPARTCDGWTTIFPAIDADIEMQATFQALHAAGNVEDAKIRITNSGAELCSGLLKNLSNPVVLASVGPTLPDQRNWLLNLPRDILNTLIGAAQSLFTNIATQITSAVNNAGIPIGLQGQCP